MVAVFIFVLFVMGIAAAAVVTSYVVAAAAAAASKKLAYKLAVPPGGTAIVYHIDANFIPVVVPVAGGSTTTGYKTTFVGSSVATVFEVSYSSSPPATPTRVFFDSVASTPRCVFVSNHCRLVNRLKVVTDTDKAVSVRFSKPLSQSVSQASVFRNGILQTVNIPVPASVTYTFVPDARFGTGDYQIHEIFDVPKSAMILGSRAFEYQVGLKSIEIIGSDGGSTADFVCTGNLSRAFIGCTSITSALLTGLNFDLTATFDLSDFFAGCLLLNKVDISTFKVESVTRFARLFLNCASLSEIDVSHWQCLAGIDFSNMFDGCSGASQIKLPGSNFITNKCLLMQRVFAGCSGLTQNLNVTLFDVSSVVSMSEAFADCRVGSLNLTQWRPQACVNFSGLFMNATEIKSLGSVQQWGPLATSSPINFSRFFAGATFDTALFSFPSTGLDQLSIDNASDLSHFFANVTHPSLGNLNLVGWSTKLSVCATLAKTFFGVHHLPRNIGSWDVARVRDFSEMFSSCRFTNNSTTPLNLAGWTFVLQTLDFTGMFMNSHVNIDPGIAAWTFPTGASIKASSLFNGCDFLPSLMLFRSPPSGGLVQFVAAVTDLPLLASLTLPTPFITTVEADNTNYANLPTLTNFTIRDMTNFTSNSRTYSFDECKTVLPSSLVVTIHYEGMSPADLSTTGLYTFVSGLPTASKILFDPPVSAPPPPPTGPSFTLTVKAGGTVNLSLGGVHGYVFNPSTVTATPSNGTTSYFSTPTVTLSFQADAVSDTVFEVSAATFSLGSETFLYQTNLLSFDTSASVVNLIVETDISGLFAGCQFLHTLDLTKVDTIDCTEMGRCFEMCTSLTSLVTAPATFGLRAPGGVDAYNIFYGCSMLSTTTVNAFLANSGTGGLVTNFEGAFENCTGLTGTLDLTTISAQPTKTTRMFESCSGLSSILFGPTIDTSVCRDFAFMFDLCESLTGTLDVSSFATTNLEPVDCRYMFAGCSGLEFIQFGAGFILETCTIMINMFNECISLNSLIGAENFRPRACTNMDYMFASCTNLSSVSALASWEAPLVTSTPSMFANCANLTEINLHGFGLDSGVLKNMNGMFIGTLKLQNLTLPTTFNTTNEAIAVSAIPLDNMFNQCGSNAGSSLIINIPNLNNFKMYSSAGIERNIKLKTPSGGYGIHIIYDEGLTPDRTLTELSAYFQNENQSPIAWN